MALLKRQPRSKREIPSKCLECASHEMPWVHLHHNQSRDPDVEVDEDDDRYCWNPKICRSRRHHAKNSKQINLARNLKSQQKDSDLSLVPAPKLLYGVLIVYRPEGELTPVHAIAAEIWNEKGKSQALNQWHCEGMLPSQVENEVQKITEQMKEEFGLKKFSLQIRREPHECPIRPCSHHSAGQT
jgi:hypothetical protein